MLICRKIDDPDRLLKRLQDIVTNTEGIVVVLDDTDVTTLLKLKRQGRDSDLHDYLDEKLKPILM